MGGACLDYNLLVFSDVSRGTGGTTTKYKTGNNSLGCDVSRIFILGGVV